MAHVIRPGEVTFAEETAASQGRTRQAQRVLQFAFTVAPIFAGADKFFHMLAQWHVYLWSAVPAALGISDHTFMYIVGVVEIAAGVLVAIAPRVGGYVVCAWLLAIVGNLLLKGGYYDIALRDFGLAVGAFALGRLSSPFLR